MRSFIRNRAGSRLALAIALATGTAVGVTGFAAPAYAAKKDKAPKKDYTKEFVAAYQPLADQLNDEAPDVAGLQAAIPGLLATVATSDDKFAAGNFVYSVGLKAKDMGLQRDGIVLMLDSGMVPVENQPQYNFLVGQLSYQLKDYAAARTYGTKAMELGYTENAPEIFVAEAYFADNQAKQGLDFLSGAIQSRLDAGQPVDQTWLQRGLALAYKSNLAPEAAQYGYWYAKMYPSANSWGDAIAILRNFNKYESPMLLDLMRLTKRTETFRTKIDYADYVEAADPRRLPGEVIAVIDHGYTAGTISKDDIFFADSYKLAEGRVAADKSELPTLEKDADAAGASLRTVVAAGDAFLNYGQAAKAERFYTKALGMPGADTALVLTRLGIAQVDQGKYAEADATFKKVEGARQAISRLWAAYAEQQASPAS